MWRILIAIGVVGCVKSSAVPCGEGLVCGEGHECRLIGDRHLCVGGQELDACLELPEGGACEVGGIMGACRDGACIAAVCGDGAVDSGEVCDDGNAAVGDGCSVECKSDETCGNGFTDTVRREGAMLVSNEQCDDTNLIAHDGCSSACRLESAVWLPVQQQLPVLGLDAAMVWDRARGRIAVFGGRAGTTDRADLLEWNGGAWILRAALSTPSSRSKHALAYDAQHDSIVVFGGTTDMTNLDDTWSWDGASWRLVGGIAAPAARQDHRMVYDARRKRIVMFGGQALASVSNLFGGGSGMPLGDTWELVAGAWTRVCASCGPSARYGHAMAFDPARGVTVMYGGFDASGLPLDDVWEFDGTWHEVTPAASASNPLARGYAAMTFDAGRGKIVVAGGTAGASPLADAIAWNGQAWSALPALPIATSHHTMAYDFDRGRTVLATGDPTRVFELEATMWREISISTPPTGRTSAIAADLERGRSVMFGGSQGPAGLVDETWLFDGERWTKVLVATRPGPRMSHAMAFDRVAHLVVLFGGDNLGGTPLGDSWTFDVAMSKWTQRSNATGRRSHQLAWDGHRVISFGGFAAGARSADTLAWSGTGWMPLSPAQAPSARTDHAMAFDPVRQRVVMFGGTAGGGAMPQTTLNDTWSWDGSTWTRLMTPTAPPPRERATLAWDAARRRMVLFGGRSSATKYDDAWELDGSVWSPIPLQLRPGARSGHLSLGGTSGVVVLGGNDDANTSQDQWLLRWDSFVPDETCRAGLDLDQDGVKGCADLDCWGRCTPLCPPGSPATCGADTPHCGDGTCSPVESSRTCPEDCGAPPVVCGDSACDAPETPSSCPGDC